MTNSSPSPRPKALPALDLNAPVPVDALPVAPNKESAFLLYAVFCGDVARTAHALSVNPFVVETLAKEHGWDAKLKPIIELKQSTRAGDVERAINRALNFVQAHQYRAFLESVLRELADMSVEDLRTFIFATSTDAAGNSVRRFSTRALADLASALEKCHAMTYLALNDTATERKERDEDGNSDATASELHLRLADAMAKSGGPSATMGGMLASAQLEAAQSHAYIDLTKCPPPPITVPILEQVNPDAKPRTPGPL